VEDILLPRYNILLCGYSNKFQVIIVLNKQIGGGFMDNNYNLISLANQDDVIHDITRYENELKQKVGQDVVLIAYSRDTKK